MDIKTLVEQPDGSAEFSGKLTPNELQFVVEFGLNVLLQNGVQIVDNADRNLVNANNFSESGVANSKILIIYVCGLSH